MNNLLHLIQRKLIWILLGTYVLAAWMPQPGLAWRAWSVGKLTVGHSTLALTFPTLVLAVLLWNAALSVDTRQLMVLRRHPSALIGGLLLNLALPLCFTVVVALGLSHWHSADEMQSLLVALAIIGSMPIAGASTAWAQSAEGNLGLSLGLVVLSTLLSPLTTPLGFHALAHMVSGGYAEDLVELAGASTQLFLVAVVVVPSIGGLLVHRLVGGRRLRPVLTPLRLVNVAALLVLNYVNAAVSLPQMIRNPDWDYLALIFVCAFTLCGLAFAIGHMAGKLLRCGPAERISLMFGLGMNNNGSGLVLASSVLSGHPKVLLVIVAYNLAQQLVAGFVEHALVLQQRAMVRITGSESF